mmetsp:Transcript_44040/g.100902  ORF Transcript_44040/g.100902 Transcript_44040/m.100902 type:complete len:218 (-) Transcript_44040:20-673(-)
MLRNAVIRCGSPVASTASRKSASIGGPAIAPPVRVINPTGDGRVGRAIAGAGGGQASREALSCATDSRRAMRRMASVFLPKIFGGMTTASFTLHTDGCGRTLVRSYTARIRGVRVGLRAQGPHEDDPAFNSLASPWRSHAHPPAHAPSELEPGGSADSEWPRQGERTLAQTRRSGGAALPSTPAPPGAPLTLLSAMHRTSTQGVMGGSQGWEQRQRR